MESIVIQTKQYLASFILSRNNVYIRCSICLQNVS